MLLAQGLYITYLPLPLALLTGEDNSQHVYISPEAFKVASREFKDQIEFWQEALPGHLKGQLASVLLFFLASLDAVSLILYFWIAIWSQSLINQWGGTLRSRQ